MLLQHERPPRPKLPLPDKMPQWCTSIGAWGDMFCALGNARRVMEYFGERQVGILHFGFDPNQREYLECQPWIGEVVQVIPPGREFYLKMIHRACSSLEQRESWLPDIIGHRNIAWQDVWPTHVDFNCQNGHECEWYSEASLPEKAVAWAEQFRSDEPTILFQPYSTQSANLAQHWPFWKDALLWIESQGIRTLFCGSDRGYMDDWSPALNSPVVDLRGKTPTMAHVLALADVCEGVVSTPNALAIWAAIRQVPALVCYNAVLISPENYFARWIRHGKNTVLDYNTSLSSFQWTFNNWRNTIR